VNSYILHIAIGVMLALAAIKGIIAAVEILKGVF
jgi:hypothetical protein